jgi:hypothetical protein
MNKTKRKSGSKRGFPNVVAHFKRMQERSSAKNLLAYKKE